MTGRLAISVKRRQRALKRFRSWSRDTRRALGRHVPRPIVHAWFVVSDWTGIARYTVPGERVTCPACESGDIERLRPLSLVGRRVGPSMGFVSGCRRCGVVFANPMPSEATLDDMYSPEGEWAQTHQDEREKIPPVRYFLTLFASVRSSFDVSAPLPGSTALDFGCGPGELLNLLEEFGWITYGIDPADKRAFPRHRELDRIPDEPMFDLAIAHHVLEHVHDPLRILRAFHGALRPNGVLLVSVPRLDTLLEHEDYRYCINSKTHVLAYTRDAMATLLTMAGFETIDLNPPPGEDVKSWRVRKRLRMLGRKVGSVRTTSPQPLAAARDVFAKWDRRATSAVQSWVSRLRPVRAAAAIADYDRRVKER